MPRDNESTTTTLDDFITRKCGHLTAKEITAATGESLHNVMTVLENKPDRQSNEATSIEELRHLWKLSSGIGSCEYRLYRKPGRYPWTANEIHLLAQLVGTVSHEKAAEILTHRLIRITKDEKAIRTTQSTRVKSATLGIRSHMITSGMTVREAAAIVGTTARVHHAIRRGELVPTKCGRMISINHDELMALLAKFETIPPGHTKLATLKHLMGIKGDKLSEYATAGHIEGARRIKSMNGNQSGKNSGVWYIPDHVAAELVRLRNNGLPMPWFGKPMRSNIKQSYERWQEQKHLAKKCAHCNQIWNKKPPKSFGDFEKRYPTLTFRDKKHLTSHFNKQKREKLKEEARKIITNTTIERVRSKSELDQDRWMKASELSRYYNIPINQMNYHLQHTNIPQRLVNRRTHYYDHEAYKQNPVVRRKRIYRKPKMKYTVADVAANLGRTNDEINQIITTFNQEINLKKKSRSGQIINDSELKKIAEIDSNRTLFQDRQQYIRISTASALISITTTTVRKWISDGDITPIKIRNILHVRKDHIIERANKYWNNTNRFIDRKPVLNAHVD